MSDSDTHTVFQMAVHLQVTFLYLTQYETQKAKIIMEYLSISEIKCLNPPFCPAFRKFCNFFSPEPADNSKSFVL